MKKLIIIAGVIPFLGCSKDKTYPNEKKITGRKWVVVTIAKNGSPDSSVVNQHQTLEFRNDGKMYLSIGTPYPYILDTVKYSFLDNDNIKITKPWASYPVDINYTITLITDNQFNFTLTSPLHNDSYIEKMIKE